jgi:hypothetical protein
MAGVLAGSNTKIAMILFYLYQSTTMLSFEYASFDKLRTRRFAQDLRFARIAFGHIIDVCND